VRRQKPGERTKFTMTRAARIFQRVFGIVLIVFVGMGIFGWEPPPVASDAQPLWDALIASGYVMPIVLLVYLLAGVSFLSDRFVPLAAMLLTPVSLNILLFHSFLNQRSVPLAASFFVANMVVLYVHRRAYAALFHNRAR
jgi:putative oxidoreductase